MAAVSPARKAAFSILLTLERTHAHSDELLRGRVVESLSPADRNLTTALVLGVLRWKLALDQELQPHIKRPLAKLDPEVLIALRLGVFQIRHMDRIPARAAIHESVELTKQSGHRFASGMVNAVLRKLAAETEPSVTSETHPAWMVERWTRFFGKDTACAICEHGQTQPGIALRIEDAAAEQELADAGIVLAPGELLAAARVLVTGDVTATQVYREGRVRIQDEGSQLVAEVAGQGSAIIDCCAAPGGKTFILAERNPAAHVVAYEASAARFEVLRTRLAPLGSRVEVRHADATVIADDASYDLVLADVPCSGTGTLGRNPELRYRLAPEEFPRQAERQQAILAAALRAARPGARIVYSTCSLEPEENEQVVKAVLLQNASVKTGALKDRIEEMQESGILVRGGAEKLKAALTPEGYLRLLPGVSGTDGFFIAMLEKAQV